MTLNCKQQLIDLKNPKVMGILNITPDSFFDGGKYKDDAALLSQVEKMLNDGATFIDVGAYSSRPGAEHVQEEEELRRIVPIIDLLIKKFPDILLSIDTFRSTVAATCLSHGAALINDISAGVLDGNMFKVVAQYKSPYIMMHLKGTPQSMQGHTNYKNLLQDILYYFSERIAMARAAGIKDIIVDPGFGFAKNVTQNYEVLGKLNLFHHLDLPLLIGLSRKSMIHKTLQTDAKGALNGTTALHMFALGKGVQILRVHDVKEAMDCIKLWEAIPSEKD
ncbi:dihydropteroate synthase [Spongiimicrobium salis]|uniref:dihydropteroate synthase n=1 Tax=Spongiimicrobium salis TaxID=1667022 RepID=UPI00374DBA96